MFVVVVISKTKEIPRIPVLFIRLFRYHLEKIILFIHISINNRVSNLLAW